VVGQGACAGRGHLIFVMGHFTVSQGKGYNFLWPSKQTDPPELMSEATCIYCRSRGTAPFPRGHVVPKAFGRFQDNLTLGCVCGACNSFFDRELELFLTRDSVETLLRVCTMVSKRKAVSASSGAQPALRALVPGPGARRRARGRHGQDSAIVSGLSRPLERRRPRYPHLPGSEERVRESEVSRNGHRLLSA